MWLLGAGALALIILAMSGGRGRRAGPPQPAAPPAPQPRIPTITTVVPPPPPAPGGRAVSSDEANLAAAAQNLSAITPRSDEIPGVVWEGLLAELRRASRYVLMQYQNRDPSLVNGRPGSGATDQELEQAIYLAAEEGLANVRFILEKTQEERRAARGQGPLAPGSITATDESFLSPATLSLEDGSQAASPPSPAESRLREGVARRAAAARPLVAPDELPRARANRTELRRLALEVVDNLNRTGDRQYDRALMKRFQRAAGLAQDGDYGPRTKQALGHYSQLPAGAVPPAEY